MPALAAASRRARLRDRRRRDQGLRPGAAAPTGLGGARAALGDRVEVSAHDRGDAAARGDVEHRQVRRPAALCGARAGRGRRRDDQTGDPAQRGGHRPQGHPRRRGGDRAARRATSSRRWSRRRRTSSSTRIARRRPRPPARCPFCDTPTVKPRDSVFTKCPNRDCPERAGSCSSTSSPVGRWTSTGWGRSRSRCCSRRGW